MPAQSNRKSKRRATVRARPTATFGATVDPFAIASRGTVAKYYPYENANQQLYHNVPLNIPIGLAGIVAGNTYLNRIGNYIKLERLDAHLWLSNKNDRPNVMYRVIVAATGVGQNADTFSEQFSIGSSFNNLLAMPDPARVMVLYDSIVNPMGPGGPVMGTAALVSTKERSFYHKLSVPINRMVSYGTDATPSTALWLWVVCYDAYATLTTDNIASCAIVSQTVFHDVDN